MMFRVFLCFSAVVVSLGEPCTEDGQLSGTCQSAPVPRLGNAMFQNKMQNKPSATKQQKAQTHSSQEPGEPMLDMTTRVAAVTERLTLLETKSGGGRTQLKEGLDALKGNTDTVSSDLNAANARLAAAEGSLSALQATVSGNNAALRTELNNLQTSYDGLNSRVGQHASAMLEENNPLVGQVADLVKRATTLEDESGNGRDELKAELADLEKQIDHVEAGGAGSLDISIQRVGSEEKEMLSLSTTVDEQGRALTTGLADVKKKLDDLSKKMGGELVQRKAAPKQKKEHAGAVSAHGDDPALSLASDLSSLETRVGLLEAKSDEGRGDLQNKLDTLSDRLATIKEGGVKSLAHTVLRVGSLETEIKSLIAEVEKQKGDVTAETDALKATLEGLDTKLGR